jgi:hypothetical protein
MCQVRVHLAVNPPRRLRFEGSFFSQRIEDFSDEDLRSYGLALTRALIDRARDLRASTNRDTTVAG